ncbi:MAG: hypothetical protein OEY11_00900 [Gammaproteobacteria bacterium]|nr:hypothetical protein [Gammaproteobacteria bacterium]
MRQLNYTLKSIIISALLWLLDSVTHFYIFKESQLEFIPSETNELWMRLSIVILFIAFGFYADRQTMTILKKEKEKRVIFDATIGSSQHILNNLLNQMQYFKTKADGENIFDDEENYLYEKAIDDGKQLVKKLSAVKELTEENILSSVYPTHNNQNNS